MINTIFSIATFLVLLSCGQNGAEIIDADKLVALQKEGVAVVDIRTPREYARGHISGVKANIDFLQSDFLLYMAKYDKSKPIVIYCQVGGRSGKAARMLEEEGFEQVYDYKGGFSDWLKKGLSVEK